MQNRGERRPSSSRSFGDSLPYVPSRRRVPRVRESKNEEGEIKPQQPAIQTQPEKPDSQGSSSKPLKAAHGRHHYKDDLESSSDEDEEKAFISIGIDLGTT